MTILVNMLTRIVTQTTGKRGLAAGAHEHALERFVVLDDMTGAKHYCFEWHVRHSHRDFSFPFDPFGEPPQETTTTDEIHATHKQVLRQFGRRLRQAPDDRSDDRRDNVFNGEAHLFGCQQHGLRQASHEVAPAHFGLVLIVRRIS